VSEDKLIKAEEAAGILDVTTQRVWELTRRDLIPHVRIGERQYRYSEKALKAWIINGGNRKVIADCSALHHNMETDACVPATERL
jgi:excisionase family DNA binding protein